MVCVSPRSVLATQAAQKVAPEVSLWARAGCRRFVGAGPRPTDLVPDALGGPFDEDIEDVPTTRWITRARETCGPDANPPCPEVDGIPLGSRGEPPLALFGFLGLC